MRMKNKTISNGKNQLKFMSCKWNKRTLLLYHLQLKMTRIYSSKIKINSFNCINIWLSRNVIGNKESYLNYMYMLLSFVGVNKWNKKSYFIQYATNCVVVFIYHIHMLYSYIIFYINFRKKQRKHTTCLLN